MKAVCDRAVLNEAYQTAQSVVSPRSPKPALQGVKLEASKKKLLLLATDLEVGIRIALTEGMEVSEEGEALLSASRVGAILRELSADHLSIEVENRSARLETSDSKFTLMGDDPADFPAIADFEADGIMTVSAEALRTMITRTIFATAREAARYALNGVLWEIRGKEIRLVATDGHRLAVAKGEATGDASVGQVSAIVPTKAMHLIERSLDDAEQVEFQVGEKQLLVRVGNTVIYSRLVDGHFPKYEDVVPQDCDKKAEVATDDFLAAIRRAALLTNEESRGVRMSFSKNEIVLSSRAPGMGEARVTVPCKFDGEEEPFEIAFNPTFFVDVLKVLDTETVTLQMKSANKPGLIRDGSGYTHVIMPVNIL